MILNIGDWEIDDVVTIFYLIFVLAILLASAFVVVWMVVLFWREINDSYVDILRLIQYTAIFIRYLTSIFIYVWYFWHILPENLIFQVLIEFLDGFAFYYYILNLITWYLLMYHIREMYQLRYGGWYLEDCNKI